MRAAFRITAAMAVFATAATHSEGQAPKRFVQDRFCISLWLDPPMSRLTPAQVEDHYRMIADANFTVVLGTGGASTPEQIARQLALCEKHGLKVLVYHVDRPADRAPEGPACWGYYLDDEPKVEEFARRAGEVRALREKRPGKLGYINLYPSHATPKHYGVATYEEYVSRFLKEVDPDVLCFDRYPLMNPDIDERDGYCENLDVIRRHAMKAGVPFWNFFCSIGYGRHYDPTESQLMWQIYTSVAYGAKGVLYFCYWTPDGGSDFVRGGAVITVDGRPTRHYEQAKRVNARFKNLGPTLMKLTSTAVRRIKPGEDAAGALAGSPIRALTDGDWLIGEFVHADGRRAVLLNNYRFAYTAWPTVEFAADAAKITEIDQQTGKEIPLADDSPAMPGLQISLDAAEGRLFLIDVK